MAVVRSVMGSLNLVSLDLFFSSDMHLKYSLYLINEFDFQIKQDRRELLSWYAGLCFGQLQYQADPNRVSCFTNPLFDPESTFKVQLILSMLIVRSTRSEQQHGKCCMLHGESC